MNFYVHLPHLFYAFSQNSSNNPKIRIKTTNIQFLLFFIFIFNTNQINFSHILLLFTILTLIHSFLTIQNKHKIISKITNQKEIMILNSNTLILHFYKKLN